MRSHGDGVDLGFERGLRLELRRSDDGAWSLALAGAAGESLSLSVPLRVPGGLAPLGEVPMISWRRAGRPYYLSLPAGLAGRRGGRRPRALPRPGLPRAALRPALGDGEDLSARWLSDQAALVDEQGFKAARDAFLDEAWQGWTKARRSPDGTLWQGADGRFVFNEEIGPALLAEAIERGEYPAQRAVVAAALDRQLRQAPDSVQSAAASAFVGSLREHVRRVRAAEAPGIERIRKLLADRDPALFLVPGLIPFVLDHGPFNLVQEIVTLAGTLRAGSLEPATALGLLEAYLDYDRYAAAGATMAARAREVVAEAPGPLDQEDGRGAVPRDDPGERGHGRLPAVRVAARAGRRRPSRTRSSPPSAGPSSLRPCRSGGERVPARHPRAHGRRGEPAWTAPRRGRAGIGVPVRRGRTVTSPGRFPSTSTSARAPGCGPPPTSSRRREARPASA